MKIAAMTEGPDWNSPVAETFAAAEWLLILEMEPAGRHLHPRSHIQSRQ